MTKVSRIGYLVAKSIILQGRVLIRIGPALLGKESLTIKVFSILNMNSVGKFLNLISHS